MKTLIVCYSFTQNNAKLARHLQRLINCEMAEIQPVKKRTALTIMLDLMFNRRPAVKPIPNDLKAYDHIVFLAPIWAGKIAMPLKAFMTNEKSNIKMYSFVTLCGGNPGQKEKIANELYAILGMMPENLIELWVNELLPAWKQNTIKYTSGYRVAPQEFSKFNDALKPLLKLEAVALD